VRNIQTSRLTTPKENRAHGDTLFPIAYYTDEWKPYETMVNCHWHEEAEFFVVLEGRTRFQIGTDYLQVDAGEAIFVHGGDIHGAFPADDQGCRFFALVFDLQVLSSVSRDLIQGEYLLPLLEGQSTLPSYYTPDEAWGRRILAELESISRAFERMQPGYEMAVKARLYLILAEIAAGNLWKPRTGSGSTQSGRLERLKTVLAYIEEHYNRRISLKELSELVPMSEGHFCRFFKSMVHQTPIEYINAYRIKRAAELLQHTDLKTLEIALEVGFDNLSYFTKKFKETMQITPMEYRRLYR
jgi:AraC-like DNA-binding protein